MQCFRLLALLLILFSGIAKAQDACKFGSTDAQESLTKDLTTAKSCQAAASRLHDCAWGSSADGWFATIVISKCESSFLNKLSPSAKKRYDGEMSLCSYEYARQEGTLYVSAAALCHVDVAEHFATNPALADRPAPHASFDCGKAQTPMEKAVCSDLQLGRADIVLSRVYKTTLKDLNASYRAALVRNQRRWLQSIPVKCTVSSAPVSITSRNCIRNEFELRFTALDGCSPEPASCFDATALSEKHRKQSTH